MDVDGDTVTVKGWKFRIDRSVPKIGEEIPQESIGQVFTFGDKTEEYDGISGKYEEFTVPYTGYYRLEVWGAQGGSGAGLGLGGKGGYSSGYVKLQKGEKLYVYVGGKGHDAVAKVSTYVEGGFNGGGNSGIPSYYTPQGYYGTAFRIRRRSDGYTNSKGKSRNMV